MEIIQESNFGITQDLSDILFVIKDRWWLDLIEIEWIDAMRKFHFVCWHTYKYEVGNDSSTSDSNVKLIRRWCFILITLLCVCIVYSEYLSGSVWNHESLIVENGNTWNKFIARNQ